MDFKEEPAIRIYNAKAKSVKNGVFFCVLVDYYFIVLFEYEVTLLIF